MPIPPGSNVSMTPAEQATWDSAVAVYEREFASRDLLFDRGMLVMLFYIAGEVIRQQLAKAGIDCKPYLYATGLFDRTWPQFRAPVETHVQAFIDGKIALEQMATNLAAAVP
jgi:hypothetical protein